MVYLNFGTATQAARYRLDRLRQSLPEGTVAIAGSAANVRWLTALAGVAHVYYGRGALFAVAGTAGDCHVVAPASELGWICEVYDTTLVHSHGTFVYRGDDRRLGRHGALARQGGTTPVQAILQAMAELPDTRRIVHDGYLPAEVVRALREARPDLDIDDDPSPFYRARQVKDPYELDRLRHANLACEAGITIALAQAHPGMTEREMLRVVRRTMVDFDAHPLLSALGFSERGALVDMPVSDRALCPGDIIRFDIGCSVEGYHADMSRTAVFGPLNPELKDLHDALVAAEKAAIERARAGAIAHEVFQAAVDTARQAGVHDYDRTHCGHGIGLEIYEPPSVSREDDYLLEAGMTLCIETPYYLLGRAGLQIEDAIVVTTSGSRRLGDLPQELLVAG
ncbi:Xaa-Pro aminopeptidase [Nonomuraea thailandensis]|uniref:Xaa-Pro aminopeptidase n=1 Tax=Nonomuraea thailandensis TaxID=1188745 RepID=A0A9X2G9D3_9ACTN|nr:Xaa-Pro peptidase family protein [Nonomuraea thailandensis]MCP2353480.1 Xaa-Pro aminopeptidase [Nonomuraea thailandensis]